MKKPSLWCFAQKKQQQRKRLWGIVPFVPIVPLDMSHRCLGLIGLSVSIHFTFLSLFQSFLSEISMFYLDSNDSTAAFSHVQPGGVPLVA